MIVEALGPAGSHVRTANSRRQCPDKASVGKRKKLPYTTLCFKPVLDN